MKVHHIIVFAFVVFASLRVPAFQVTAQYPTTCECLQNGNCSGTGCSTGEVKACGDQCPPGYKNVEMICATTGSCGGKCVYEQTCVTGYCAVPPCENVEGSFLCGDGGCNSCSRLVRTTTCNGSFCQAWCSLDETCGTGCSGPGPGATNTPVPGPGPGPTDTPGPTPTNTPVPLGTIEARAVRVDVLDTSCTAIRAVPTLDGEINGTTHQFTPASASQPAAKAQVGAQYAVFSGVITGSYTLDPNPPTANWAYVRPCWTNVTTGEVGEGLSRTLAANQTLRWDIGYTLGTAWVQTEGGDVYSSGTIRSSIPSVSPRVFITDGAGGYPGVVSYGTLYDFDSDPFSEGATLVSRTNWQVNEGRTPVNYYDYFLRRFGSPTTPTTSAPFDTLAAVTKPASNCTAASCTPYFVSGNMTTSGNWSVGNNERIVILVDGNLTIGGRITITGNGFIAFIVNGTITIADTVGTTWGSTTPVVEGVYIATRADQAGRIETGASIAAATARFVGEGMFIADGFLLQRDLDTYGGNVNAAAELFTYDPQLLLTMPDTMKDLSVTWQEVAP